MMNGITVRAKALSKGEVDLLFVVLTRAVVGDDVERGAKGLLIVLVDDCVKARMKRLALENTDVLEDTVGRFVGVAEDDERAVDWTFHNGNCGDDDMLKTTDDCTNEVTS